MKLHTNTTLLKSSGVVERAQARVNMNAVAFQVLSSRLYSDKEGAPIREIGCNAADAHIMMGTPDRPFEIKLPTPLDPSFAIRDFGPGLSHDDVMQNYQTYFHSTKNESDDVTGCFGLGSKSPYAYTDQFTVRSVYDGIMRTYFCAFDETGVPCTSLVAEQPAGDDWPHGVEVSMPVKYGDQSTFQDKAQRIFQWFRVPPKVTGGTEIRPVEYAWRVGRFRRILTTWSYGVYEPHLIMGNVAYTFKTHAVAAAADNDDSVPKWVRGVLDWIQQHDLVFEVPIGTVDVTASRETVEYNDRTNKALIALIVEEIKSLAEKIDTYIAGIGTVTSETIDGIFDQFGDNAGLTIVKEFDGTIAQYLDQKNRSVFETAMAGEIKVDGWETVVENAKINQRCAPHGQLWYWDNDRRRSRNFTGYVPINGKTIVLVNDRPTRASDRVMALMRENKDKQVLILGCADKAGWQDIPPLLEFNDVPIVFKFVSSLPKPDKQKLGIGMTVRRKGDSKLLGVWDVDNVNSQNIPARGFEPADMAIKDVPDTDRWYVVREAGGWGARYMNLPGRNRQDSWPYNYFGALESLRKEGFPVPSHIAVVTAGQVDKLKLAEFGFQPLHRWYTDVLKKDQRVIDYMNETPHHTTISFSSYGYRPLVTNLFAALLKRDPRSTTIESFLKGTPLLDELLILRDEYEAARALVNGAQQKTEPDWYGQLAAIGLQKGATVYRQFDFDKQLKELQEKYPKLDVLGNEIKYQSGVFDFQMMAVAMAVSPQQPVILTTAEET